MLVSSERDILSRAALLPCALRSYQADDLADIVALLRDLPELYPDGDRWLHARLAHVLDGRARATVAVMGEDYRTPVGVTIETPKGETSMKLSTLFVAPIARRCGVGSRLMLAAERRWLREGVVRVHITADLRRADEVERTVGKHGFRRLAVEVDRYGPDRSEAVLVREV